MSKFIISVQVISSIFLIVAILLQQKGIGLGGAFGGTGSSYRSKRGAEKFLFYATVFMALSFFIVTIIGLVLYK